MVKLSNDRKERVAVHAIREEILKKHSFLKEEIPEGDKFPSFDGHITVYKDDSGRKESYLNDIPTQVKGTGVNKFSQGNRSFSLEMAHYENYRRRGGCLLLVVEINEETMATKIFYKPLLPLDLSEIVRTSRKSVSVELRPMDETTMYSLCRKFIDQMAKQPQILIDDNQFQDHEYEKIILSSITFDPSKCGYHDIFNHSFFQFGLKDNIEYPVRKVGLSEISFDQQEQVYIGQKIFTVDLKNYISSSKYTFIIDDCLEFSVLKDTNKINFKLTKVKSLNAQLTVLPIIIEFLKIGKIEISTFYAESSLNGGSHDYITELENTYSKFKDLEMFYDRFNIDKNIEFIDKSNIYDQIEFVVDVAMNNDYERINRNLANPDMVCYITLNVFGLCFLIFYDTKGIVDPFNENFKRMKAVVIEEYERKEQQISPYILLEKEALIHAVNIDHDIILRSIKDMILNEPTLPFTTTNRFCLNCLTAYDNVKNSEFLTYPILLYEKLKTTSTDNDTDKSIATINLMQTKLRKYGKLNDDEYNELYDLKQMAPFLDNGLELEFCISVLFKNKKEAEILFKKFSRENQLLYEDMPIFYTYSIL